MSWYQLCIGGTSVLCESCKKHIDRHPDADPSRATTNPTQTKNCMYYLPAPDEKSSGKAA